MSPHNCMKAQLQFNIWNTLKDLQCEYHDYLPVIAICIEFECDENTRLCCQQCLVSHKIILYIQNIYRNNKDYFSFLAFIVSDIDSVEIKWLKECVLQGTDIDLQSFTSELIMTETQKSFQTQINDMRFDVEKSVKSMKLCKSPQLKVSQIKDKIDRIIKNSQQQLLQLYDNQYDDSEQRSTMDMQIITLEKDIQFSSKQFDNSINDSLNAIQNPNQTSLKQLPNIQAFLPTFNFIDNSPKKKSWIGKQKVTSQMGGKIITLNNGLIFSNESFTSQNVIEIRIKTLNIIQNCIHFGIIEESTYNLGCDPEKVGQWGCLNGQCNSARMQIKQWQYPQLESIIGLQLDFINDQITILYYKTDMIHIMWQKNGELMKQKFRVFIKNIGEFRFELIN
ncbi:hypothetical protein pb186bvf_013023 [Paramecium bursaria]